MMPFPKLFLLPFCLTLLWGHEEPGDVIDALTHKLEEAIPTERSVLLYQRAMEHLALRQHEKARVDLKTVTTLEPSHFSAWKELAALTEESAERVVMLNKALELSEYAHQRAAVHLSLAEHYYYLKELSTAQKHSQLAVQTEEESQDFSAALFHSHLLFMQGEHDARVLFLEQVRDTSPSIVLQHQWIHAMIQAGRQDEVRGIIHQEMETSRFKSSWLIRAALCEISEHGATTVKAKDYAQAAITEIKHRLNPDRADITLLMDLSHCHAIIGEPEKAEILILKIEALPHISWQIDALQEKMRLISPLGS